MSGQRRIPAVLSLAAWRAWRERLGSRFLLGFGYVFAFLLTARIIERELREETSHTTAGEGPVSLGALVERYLAADFASQPDGIPPRGLYDRIIEEVEAPLIRLTLAATRGNQIRAAEILGLNRNTLRKKIHDLGLQAVRTKT